MQLPVSVLAEATTIGGVTPLIPKGEKCSLPIEGETLGQSQEGANLLVNCILHSGSIILLHFKSFRYHISILF